MEPSGAKTPPGENGSVAMPAPDFHPKKIATISMLRTLGKSIDLVGTTIDCTRLGSSISQKNRAVLGLIER
jgi:hypothetical protein